jgi:hypothetical protein
MQRHSQVSSSCLMLCVMALDKGWHIIFGFAVTGFLIAMLAGCCMDFNAPNAITNLLLWFSPGLWLLLERVLGNVPFDNDHVAVWVSISFVAIVNGMLYALVGAAIVGVRWILKQRVTAK